MQKNIFKTTIILAVLSLGLTASAGFKNPMEASSWVVKGTGSVRMRINKEEGSICFDANFLPKKTGQIHPGLKGLEGSLREVHGIRFDLKLVPVEGKFVSPACIIFGGVKHFFKLPKINEWKKNLTVMFVNLKTNRETAKGFQILIYGKLTGMRCYMKNITFLDKNGQPLPEDIIFEN